MSNVSNAVRRQVHGQDLNLRVQSGNHLARNHPSNSLKDGTAPFGITELTVSDSTDGDYNQTYAWVPAKKYYQGNTDATVFISRDPAGIDIWYVGPIGDPQYAADVAGYDPRGHYFADGIIVDADGIDIIDS